VPATRFRPTHELRERRGRAAPIGIAPPEETLMTALRTNPLPNVLSNEAAPNTLSGMTAGPAHAPRAAASRFTLRQSWRGALFGGVGLAVVITILATRVS
jgi:hypothetical protein